MRAIAPGRVNLIRWRDDLAMQDIPREHSHALTGGDNHDDRLVGSAGDGAQKTTKTSTCSS